MAGLAQKKCVPCEKGTPPLKPDAINSYVDQVNGWEVEENQRIRKPFKFPDFVQALAFVNRVGEVAENEGHHPDIFLTYGKVEITLWTHSIGGLSEADFVMAAKIDEVPTA